jgi:AraC-like DNA-binding protein
MEYAIYKPPVHLQPYVKNFWSLENSKGEVLPPVYKSMADGYTEVVFATNGGFKEYYNYSGYLLPQHSTNRALTIGKTIGLFGIRLYPYALQPLFGIASLELVNHVHQLNSVTHRDLVDQVSEAKDQQDRLEKVCAYLTKKLTHNPTPIEKVIQLLMASQGQASIAELQQLTGLSERQFERKFKSIIGFTPKRYSRIIRFQYTRRKFVAQPRLTFAELAYQCNYADQSHFIREFKEFSGMSVTEYSNLINTSGSEEAKVIRGLILAKDEPYDQHCQYEQRKKNARFMFQ